MASDGRQQPHRARTTRFALLALATALLALAACAAPAGAEVVYDNPPATGEVEALNFEATGTAELGTLVRFAGSARLDPQVRVAVVAAGCEDEDATEGGSATPGATFSLPATLSFYAANADGSPGPLLARQAKTFALSYEGLQSLGFELPGVTLPPEAIVAIAFDTATGGYAPTGVAGPADALGVALAGPAAVGAGPRAADGVYRAATGAAFGFEAAPGTWEGRQPAFTVEAAAAPGPVPAAAAAASSAATAATAATGSAAPTLSAPRSARREYRIPASKRMTLSFPRGTARIAGPGALVQVRCTGSSAARCIGTLSLSAAGEVHKVPYSIGKGRRQYVVVPLGSDLALIDDLGAAQATATASTVQAGGAAVKTKRALKLK